MAKITFESKKRENKLFGGWSRVCIVNGVKYAVSVSRGKSVRIPYMPRGRNIGWHWHGYVGDFKRGRIWSGRVSKNIGARGLLKESGVIE